MSHADLYIDYEFSQLGDTETAEEVQRHVQQNYEKDLAAAERSNRWPPAYKQEGIEEVHAYYKEVCSGEKPLPKKVRIK